ncbi:aminotransferase class I/II-fold pyridoxal phosphate-dependent enzyme [Pseudoroseicyclus sp. H15]
MTIAFQVRERLPVRKARALSQTIMEMVSDGALPAGTRMPTVRDMAKALGMSASSVATAWGELVEWHVLQTSRRGGTLVLGPAVTPRATRYDAMMRASEGCTLNLGHLICDPALLPPVGPALEFAARAADINTTDPEPISNALRAAVAPDWPVETDAFLATHGGVDAINLALRSTVRPGDKVIVESPCMTRLLDIIDFLGATAVPVEYGPDGPDLDQLAAALKTRPAAMVYQPASQHPTGRSITPEWIDKAAVLLKDAPFPIVEMVQTPFLVRGPIRSLGTRLPQAVVQIWSFNFFFGSDLRVGVVGGARLHVDRMWLQLTYSSRWVSRLMQNALAFQITDPGARRHLEALLDACHDRHQRFTEALVAEGFPIAHQDGPAIWLPVEDEHVAAMQMSGHGTVVHPGSFFTAAPMPRQHVLINGTAVAAGHAPIAAQLARAAGLSRGFRPDAG